MFQNAVSRKEYGADLHLNEEVDRNCWMLQHTMQHCVCCSVAMVLQMVTLRLHSSGANKMPSLFLSLTPFLSLSLSLSLSYSLSFFLSPSLVRSFFLSFFLSHFLFFLPLLQLAAHYRTVFVFIHSMHTIKCACVCGRMENIGHRNLLQ